MQLYAHQQRILDKNPKKYLIAHGTGTGKTFTALSLADKNKVPAIIIVPKALKETWGRAISMFHEKHLIMSKEEFRRDWQGIAKYNAIIIDEAHAFANYKSLLSKALTRYQKLHKPEYVWLLTATPYCSSALNIFTLANHLGYNLNYWSFFNEYFYNVRMGARMVPKQRPDIEKKLSSLVQKIGDTCKLEECVDVPEQQEEVLFTDLTIDQENAISLLDESVHIVRWTKIHQIMGGSLKGNEYEEDKIIKSNKLEILKNLIEENPKSIVVCRYNNEINYLKEELEKITPVFIINGVVDNRDEIIQSLKDKEEYCLIVNAMCSEGWELKECPLMIFYSYSFSLKDKIQMEGRIQRIDFIKKNVYTSIVVKDSIDEDIFNCINNKMDFHLAIYAKDKL